MKHIKYIILTLLTLLLFASCYSTRVAKRQIIKAQANYPIVLSKYCGNLYPPITETKEIEKLIPGKTDTIPGEIIIIDCDSVLSNIDNNRATPASAKVKVPCPPSTHRVDTFTKTVLKTVENKAKITALESKLKKRDLFLTISICFNIILIIYSLIKYFNHGNKRREKIDSH